MQPITDRVYAVPGMSIGRMYVIKGDDGLAVVDTSLSPQTASKLAAQLQGAGFSLADVRHILITHAHPDHIGGLAEFQRQVNARTYVHHRDAATTRGEAPIVRPRPEHLDLVGRLMVMGPTMQPPTPARVDVELKGGESLDEILPSLQVIETPGHSPGHVGYWWPEKRLLFGGDAMMHMPWGLALPIASFTVDMAEAKRSVARIAELNVSILCPGHGRPIVGDAARPIKAFADRLKP